MPQRDGDPGVGVLLLALNATYYLRQVCAVLQSSPLDCMHASLLRHSLHVPLGSPA